MVCRPARLCYDVPVAPPSRRVPDERDERDRDAEPPRTPAVQRPLRRIARLAARAVGVPMAVIRIGNDRHATVVGHGVDSTTLAALDAFATLVAASTEVVVVPDASLDARLAESAFVARSPAVRFCAGAPIVSQEGVTVGSLCLFDTLARPGLAEGDAETLRDAAELALEEMRHDVRLRDLLVAQEEARRLATTDPLTGLSNRRTLDETLDSAIALARRTGHALAVLMIDLEGFEAFNERHGRERADAVLIAMAERLERGVREHDLVARVGGDEFVVVLQAVDRAAVAEAAGRIHEALTREISLGDGEDTEPTDVRLRASVGVALHPVDGEDLASLLRAADLAMYDAKAGGGGVRRFAPR
jgi:diguanylate cyclase